MEIFFRGLLAGVFVSLIIYWLTNQREKNVFIGREKSEDLSSIPTAEKAESEIKEAIYCIKFKVEGKVLKTEVFDSRYQLKGRVRINLSSKMMAERQLSYFFANNHFRDEKGIYYPVHLVSSAEIVEEVPNE